MHYDISRRIDGKFNIWASDGSSGSYDPDTDWRSSSSWTLVDVRGSFKAALNWIKRQGSSTSTKEA